jgi:hypothetical protein
MKAMSKQLLEKLQEIHARNTATLPRLASLFRGSAAKVADLDQSR